MSREMKSLDFPAGFPSSSKGQVNSGVAAKEHSRVHLSLGLALDLNPLDCRQRLDYRVQTGEDGMPQSTPYLGNPQTISGSNS
ncbi:unnamed protein product [Nezara viridula]|uniref:Uncharacterized protein n=1 Tax=Nezara viridula TaxID=85310 RepID=A0A9P0E9S1_NEZVI|nr:unnamed protein product [Nezara viridula]